MALEKAEGFKEEGQLKYKIAISQSEGSSPIEGVRLLKEVAANTAYTRTIRAYSVQYLGHLLYAINTKEINDEVFKDEPYKSFLSESGNDSSVARRKLYEYASSLYPLGIPELRIARWYSEEILRLQKSDGAENKEKVEGMKSIIQQKLASSDTYLASIVNDEQARSYVAEVLYRKANVQGDLYLAGDKDFGDPEETYEKSLTVATATNKVGSESSAKVYYAMYLAKMYGKERSEDIKSLLKDFYEGSRYSKTNTVKFIRGEKDNRIGLRKSFLLLAEIDAKFHDFLLSLDWQM